MINKVLVFLMALLICTSCNKYARNKYPQLVSRPADLHYINSCYSAYFDDLTKIPTKAKSDIDNYLKQRIGTDYYNNLSFATAYVLSDKPIEIKHLATDKDPLELLSLNEIKKECDTSIVFPVYAAIYNLKVPEAGIDKIGLHIMIDNDGEPVKDIEFPKRKSLDKIIPIDSVHSELIRRRIPYKNLNIELLYDQTNQSLIWSTNTLVREGSIAGPNCFPEYEYHFNMNALTGEITENNPTFGGM